MAYTYRILNKFGKWSILKELGTGGQGKVYRVIDTKKFNRVNLAKGINISLRMFSRYNDEEHAESLCKDILDLIKSEDPVNHGALKVLHKPEESRDAGLAKDRIKREIETMKKLSHPNFIKILDVDPQREWFVSQFYTRGTLSNNKEIFTGDLVKSLNAFRPLAEAVAQLYQNKIVHRDIKPQNVFLDVDGRLILGDFGLVYFADQQHTRISETFENVGSHDWMPGWAMGMKIEDIKPTFDVFCLGKLLWAMLSKTPILRLWYYDKPEFDLEKMFPNKPEMKWANELFKKCIVEEERNCLPDASALLEEVDKVITAVNYHADVIGDKIIRRCKVCGIGNYNQIVNEESTAGIQNFGFVPAGTRTFKIYTCTHCGHVQFFTYERKDKRPQAWLK